MLAGATVGIMLVPQSMAYAMIAGLPPVYGLYAAIFPQLIYALLGTSRQLAVGPVAMDSLLVFTGLSAISIASPDQYLTLALALAFLMGSIQLLMGVVKAGFIVNFLSRPVINGFTFAAALVISIHQIKHLTGLDLQQSKYILNTLIQLVQSFDSINWTSMTIGSSGIAVIFILKKWNKLIPGALIVMSLSILVVYQFDLAVTGVKVIGDIPQGLPNFTLPLFSTDHLWQLLPVAGTLAVIGFMEAFSVAKAIETKHKHEYKLDANRELIALGAGNIFGSFMSSFPTSGGFSRSAVNESSGARTGIASFLSAGLVIIVVLFLTPIFYHLPQAVLAAIIMVAVLGLIDIKRALHLWHTDRTDFYMLISTFLGTLLIGIMEGIVIGVSLSLLVMIYRTTRPHMAVLGRIPGTEFFKNINRFEEAEEIENTLIVRFDSRLYFANANYFKESIEQLMNEKENLKLLIIDAQSISNVDSSGMTMLRELLELCTLNKIELAFISVIGPVRDIFVKEGFAKILGKDHCFERIDPALSAFLHPNQKPNPSGIKFQSNEN